MEEPVKKYIELLDLTINDIETSRARLDELRKLVAEIPQAKRLIELAMWFRRVYRKESD